MLRAEIEDAIVGAAMGVEVRGLCSKTLDRENCKHQQPIGKGDEQCSATIISGVPFESQTG